MNCYNLCRIIIDRFEPVFLDCPDYFWSFWVIKAIFKVINSIVVFGGAIAASSLAKILCFRAFGLKIFKKIALTKILYIMSKIYIKY
jgi:hypothetical protein